MDKIFLSVLNMSLTSSFVIVTIMLARLPLKKAPKIISYALWAVAGFRLVFPFTLESVFSLLPFKSTPIPQNIAMQEVPRIDSGITVIDNAVSAALPAATPLASVNPLQIWIFIGSCVWLFGIAVMLIYSFVSIILLKRRLRGAVHIEGNLYEVVNLRTPFVIGIFSPKIYIPAGLSDEECRYIVLHEQTHIRRHDHAVKMFAYLVLCLHWFNPLVWAAFVLMGADMEISCDERVMRELGMDIKNAYSLSLVRVASGRKILNGSPLAFGEGGMKERIKNVLNFQKPSRVIITLAIALVSVLSVGFAVNRVSTGETARDLQYFDANGFQLGNVIDDTANLTPVEPLSGNQYDYNLAEGRYSLDPELGVIRKMSVTLYDDGCRSAYNTGLEGSNPWYTIEEVTEFFGPGKSGWQNKEQRLRYVEYTQKEGRLSATVRFVYTDGESDGLNHRLVWILAESSLPYPKPVETPSRTEENRPTLTLYGYGTNTDNGDADEVKKHFIERLQPEANTGWTILTDMIFIDVQIPDGTVAVQIYYAEAGTEATAHIMFDGKYSIQQKSSPTDPRGNTWRAADYYPAGFLGHIWAVTVDADGTDHYSDIINVIYEPKETTPPDEDISQRVENGLSIIMSSPLTSSNPQDYINAHWNEYENLTMKYSDGVLEYLLSQFEEGNSGGLRGHIMMRMCKEMLGVQNNVTDESLSPQEWYKQLSIISEIKLPDFKPENPVGEYGELTYSAIAQYYSRSGDGFMVAAPTVYGAYEEEGKLKIFVTVFYKRYRLYGKTLESTGGAVIPGAIIFQSDNNSGGWIFEEYLEVGSANLPDGSYFNDSIRKLCVMPVSGYEIKGLAETMNADYVNDDRRELLMQNLKEHLTAHGQTGVYLKMPNGSMVELT